MAADEFDRLARSRSSGWLVSGHCARHPLRSLGLVPCGACGFAVALGLVSLNVAVGPALCVAVGITYSLVNVPLAAAYQGGLPADARGNGMAARNFCDYAVSTILAGAVLGAEQMGRLERPGSVLAAHGAGRRHGRGKLATAL